MRQAIDAPTDEPTLTSAELARVLGVSRRAINSAATAGRIPIHRHDGPTRLYRLSDVAAALREQSDASYPSAHTPQEQT